MAQARFVRVVRTAIGHMQAPPLALYVLRELSRLVSKAACRVLLTSIRLLVFPYVRHALLVRHRLLVRRHAFPWLVTNSFYVYSTPHNRW